MEITLHSTNGHGPSVSLPTAVAVGLASDKGYLMPDRLPTLPRAFFRNMGEMTVQELGYAVLDTLLGSYLSSERVKDVVDKALNFDIPLRTVTENISMLELYHGPSLSFRDVGSRILAEMIDDFAPVPAGCLRHIVLATTGDSGGAAAAAYAGHPDVRLFVLFPKDRLSRQQIAMFAGSPNVTAIEVDGSYAQCQELMAETLLGQCAAPLSPNRGIAPTCANSANVARTLASTIYYFQAYARVVERLEKEGRLTSERVPNIVLSVDCQSTPTYAAALMAMRMGLPVRRLIAVNNAYGRFVDYLRGCASDPSLPHGPLPVEEASVPPLQAREAMRVLYEDYNLVTEPQAAAAVATLQAALRPGDHGVALAPTHPAKFRNLVEAVLDIPSMLIPEKMRSLPHGPLKLTKIPATAAALQRVVANTK